MYKRREQTKGNFNLKSESDLYRRQVLTPKVGPRAESVNHSPSRILTLRALMSTTVDILGFY